MGNGKWIGPVVACCGALLALGLTGCSTAAPPPPAVTTVAPPATSAPTAAPTPTSSSPATTTNGETTPVSGQCRLDDLRAEQADAPYQQGLNAVIVVWTNRSDRTCTMNGFGGLDLLDAQGQRISATRTDEATTEVSLAPGDKAHSTVSYPAAGGTSRFRPTTALATPPNETQSARLQPWTGAAIPQYPDGDNEQVRLSPIQPNAS